MNQYLAHKNKRKGQALVEYVLVIFYCVLIFKSIQYISLKGTGKLWLKLAQEIAPACPVGCIIPDELQ